MHKQAQNSEYELKGNGVALGVFLDVEGAFDYALYNNLMLDFMHRRRVTYCITQWLKFMFRKYYQEYKP